MKLRAQSASSAVAVLIMATLGSNLLGLLRELLVAHAYGASGEYDAFVIAQYVPSWLYSALFVGIPNVFTPLFFQARNDPRDPGGEDFQARFFGAWLCALVVFCGVLALAAPWIAAGFTTQVQSDRMSAVPGMIRLLMIGMPFGIAFILLRSFLGARMHFRYPALALLMYNGWIILFVVAGSGALSINALIYGTVAGMSAQLFVLLFVFWRRDDRVRVEINYREPLVRRSFAIAMPVLGLELLWGAFYVLDGFFASRFSTGSVSVIAYASTLLRLPGLLVGATLASVLLPRFSEAASQNNQELMRVTFIRVMRIVVVVMIPLSCGVVMVGRPVIRALYEHGAFDAIATVRTSEVLSILAPGVLILTAYPIMARMLNAFHMHNFLFLTFGASLVLKVLMFYGFLVPYGVNGVAIAMIASLSVTVLMVGYALIRRIGTQGLGALVRSAAKVLAVSACGLALGVWVSIYAGLPVLILGVALVSAEERVMLWNVLRERFSRMLATD